jgi:heterodisulfide reductase subunit A2
MAAEDQSLTQTDALVVGGGIAGLQTALDLAEQGFQVVVVEREPSIGGKMIALSKVFPTLDCASCITTPKMSAAAHHPRIRLITYAEVDAISPADDGHLVTITRKPRYVDEDRCIGCRLCEYACEMEYPDPFEQGLGVSRAIGVPFTNAIPQKAVLNPDYCIACGACARACPTDAIDYAQQPQQLQIMAQTVIVASGFQLNALTVKPQYSADLAANVISPLAMERLLAPHGPYGRVLRPSDGKIPGNIAYVQCAGSRDKSIAVPYCSRVCCMYAIKQAMLLSGALPLADITIYYMDIRAFGKGYEQFYQTAKAMGIRFVRGKVARIEPADDDDALVHVEAMEEPGGPIQVNRHDLVVLSQGMLPHWNAAAHGPIEIGSDGFVAADDPLDPAHASLDGVFVAGTAAGPMDIVDAIAAAGNAAMQAGTYLRRRQASTGDRRRQQ